MLEITPADIANLSDGSLRALVGRLCEAELTRRGLSAAAVTWGGSQDAPDGGIDARVRLDAGSPIEGFVPRAETGYQVKKPEMGPAEVLAEMRPSGTLRPSIAALAEKAGAYIIVSSGSNLTDSMLAARLDKMAEAVRDTNGGSSLFLDFYDRSRVATWLRSHPGLIAWTRREAGRPLRGWRSYEAWAHSPGGVDEAYLIDDTLRLHIGNRDAKGVSALQGIAQLRARLAEPRSIARLAGLSGVGKTRLVQALFDPRVGEGSLDPALAFYTDMADDPDPQPIGMASDLIAMRTRALLIVDNCPQDLHRRLAEVCRAPESRVSVITVEYDIQEDQPEGTEVFRLESSSVELIEKLLRQRFPSLSQIDARTAATFSGGNARIALALVNTLEQNETLAGLNDNELFERLFFQRQGKDNELLLAAEALALVYSFEGEALEGDGAELPRLAAICGMDGTRLFRHVAELKRRDLVQRRNVWRAVLPHAIANRLAKRALQDFPAAVVHAQLVVQPSARLLRSFAHRLGYLHDSPEARSIASKWLAPDGMLGNIASLHGLDGAMFNFIAPVVPEATLSAIQRMLERKEEELEALRYSPVPVAKILRSLAYEPSLFDRCVIALRKLVTVKGGQGQQRESAERVFASLFYIVVSGTIAPLAQRLQHIKRLLNSNDDVDQHLGLGALKAALTVDHFRPPESFEFGARPRNLGYQPKTVNEQIQWFSSVLTAVEPKASSTTPLGARIRHVLAKSFRGLWMRSQARDVLEKLVLAVASHAYWEEAWIATRQTLRYHAKDMRPEDRERLEALEQKLRPRNLVEQVRAVVLTKAWGALDYAKLHEREDDEEAERGVLAPMRKANEVAEALGRSLAADSDAFQALAPELVQGDGARLFQLGRGLAFAARERRPYWDALVQAVGRIKDGERNIGVLGGFLNGLHEVEPGLAQSLLDEAVSHPILGYWIPALATSVPLDDSGVARLRKSLTDGLAPVRLYGQLAGGRASDAVGGKALRAFLFDLASRPGGFPVALDVLAMRLHSDRDSKRDPDLQLILAGREMLADAAFVAGDDMHDYRLRMVVVPCLAGSEGQAAARSFMRKFIEAARSVTPSASQYDQFLGGLLKVQTAVVLDELIAGDENALEAALAALDLSDDDDHRKNPLDEAPDEAILAWCAVDPAKRFPFVARIVSIFSAGGENAALEWRPLAVSLLNAAPDMADVLRQFMARFRPTSWSGSRAAIMEARLALLDRLPSPLSPKAAALVAEERESFRQEIQNERRYETTEDRERDETFE
jgi:hypothetical protein